MSSRIESPWSSQKTPPDMTMQMYFRVCLLEEGISPEDADQAIFDQWGAKHPILKSRASVWELDYRRQILDVMKRRAGK